VPSNQYVGGVLRDYQTIEYMEIEIILTGNFGVGKSALFDRFLYDRFEEAYTGTIGVRVNQRDLEVNGETVEVILWDIAGERTQTKVPVTYFANKEVIIYVVDLTRPYLFKDIKEDLQYLRKVAPDSQIKLVGNKKDLFEAREIAEIGETAELEGMDLLLSAKTGEHVNILFENIVKSIMEVKKEI